MSLLSTQDWQKYQQAIDSAMETFAQKEITWKRSLSRTDRFGETMPNSDDSVTLKCLCNYNVYRTWPITQVTDTGELDKQSIQLFFSKSYLNSLGYLNANGYFDYNPDTDRFIIDGLVHKPFGDTPVSQIHNQDLLFAIIVKREETQTGNER